MTALEGNMKGRNETILIIGGERDDENLDETLILDRETSTWKVLDSKLLCKNRRGGSVLLNGEIYIFGREKLKKKLYKLDSQQIKWIELAEMNEEQKNISNSSLVFQGCIWVFGGWSEKNAVQLKTVEKYRPEKNKWIKAPLVSANS